MVDVTEVKLSLKAPAKLNLHLAVRERREDGYHNLISLFQKIDLYDTITLHVTPSKWSRVNCSTHSDFSSSDNSMLKAARLFLKEVGLKATLNIEVIKNIPSLAGIGGASSDAAAVLRLLNEATGFPYTLEELTLLGQQVGSDVPFFLQDSPFAYVTGRGEFVESLESRSDLYGLIVIPKKCQISTPWAFKKLAQMRGELKSAPLRDSLISMYHRSVSEWDFSNDFSELLYTLHPAYTQLEIYAKEEGELFYAISGSGSSFFVLSERKEKIERLSQKLETFPYQIALYMIKSLHPGNSGATVLL